MTSYYRIQREAPETLLDGPQVSHSWNDLGDDARARAGKSVTDSREELAEYIAQTGITFEDSWYLIELDGTPSDDVDEDAHLGARLIHPTRILAVETLGDAFASEILDAYEALTPTDY